MDHPQRAATVARPAREWGGVLPFLGDCVEADVSWTALFCKAHMDGLVDISNGSNKAGQ